MVLQEFFFFETTEEKRGINIYYFFSYMLNVELNMTKENERLLHYDPSENHVKALIWMIEVCE